MNLEFVSLQSTDGLALPGLLFTPTEKTLKVAVWLHGMGDNGVFYKPSLINPLAEALTERGIACLAFNNRGAHNAKKLKLADESLPAEERSYQGGTYYEQITDCVKDIDGAVQWLSEYGFTELYLLGHSTGSNKVCVYLTRVQDNPFAKYVLAGVGDDTGGFYAALGTKKFWSALQYAAQAVTAKDGVKVMPKYTGMYPFSAQTTWDILNPDGAYNTFPFYESAVERLGTKELFKEYLSLDRPTLVIMGEQDEYAETVGGAKATLDIMLRHTSNAQLKTTDFQLVHDADHSFHNHETAFATQVGDWLAQ